MRGIDSTSPTHLKIAVHAQLLRQPPMPQRFARTTVNSRYNVCSPTGDCALVEKDLVIPRHLQLGQNCAAKSTCTIAATYKPFEMAGVILYSLQTL